MDREWINFDSQDLQYKRPFGAVLCSKTVDLKIMVEGEAPVCSLSLKIWGAGMDEETRAMEYQGINEGKKIYQIAVTMPDNPGLLWYYFIINREKGIYYYGNNTRLQGGRGEIYDNPPPAYQITVYQEDNFPIPAWYKEAVVYQIFVDRFFNGSEDGRVLNPKPQSLLHGDWQDTPLYLKENSRILRWDFFGGNLAGIRKKLPYLKGLGIGVLYLNPVFESPSNHKYDTADYLKIDPMFGDEDAFAQLCREAGELGIRIILDGVFSHTGSDSVYFNKNGNYPGLGAYQSKDSPYYSWYRFSDYPNRYQSWWGIDTMPNVCELEPGYLDFILDNENSVIRHWMRKGVKGWRLDVADELPDEFIEKLRGTCKDMDPDSVIIGEVWEDASRKVSYDQLRKYLWGRELESVTNYPFRKILLEFILGSLNNQETHWALMSLYENYPRENFYAALNLAGSHDVPRVLTLLGDAPCEAGLSDREKEKYRLTTAQRSLARDRLKLLSLFQMTFPGVPCIYYGDEAGLEGFSDPYNRGPYPWDREDRELLSWYKRIIALRNHCPVFTRGEWHSLGDSIHRRSPESPVYGFLRIYQEETALVLLNRDPGNLTVLDLDLGDYYQDSCLYDFLGENREIILEGSIKITLRPLEGKVLFNKKITLP